MEPDAPHAEERDGQAFAMGESRVADLGAVPEEGEVAGHRPDHEDEGEADDDTPPVELREEPVGEREPEARGGRRA